MSWDALATFALALATAAGVNLGALKWMLDRHFASLARGTTRLDEMARELYELRAQLPLEYVRREDWIRFSGTLDAKLDAMREEMREEIAGVKERLYARYD
jgi:hypothetical protein